MNIVYVGMDNVDFSLKGKVDSKFIEALKKAKETAQEKTVLFP